MALFAIGFSCIILGALVVWPFCWGSAAFLGVLGLILKKRTTPLSEKESELHQSFVPAHRWIVLLLVFAVFVLSGKALLYSLNSPEVLDNRNSWGCALQSIWGGLLVGNILGSVFVTWLEKQFYRMKF